MARFIDIKTEDFVYHTHAHTRMMKLELIQLKWNISIWYTALKTQHIWHKRGFASVSGNPLLKLSVASEAQASILLLHRYNQKSPQVNLVHYMWPNLRKGTFFTHKIWPIFWTLKFHNFFILAYTSLKLSMVVAKVSGYSLVLWASWSAYVVKSYIILFDGMSNVWKRYLFANPVTYQGLE